MSAHRWLSNDVNPPEMPGDPVDVSQSCYACGVTVDATAAMEDAALWLLPPCPGPIHDRAHHYIYVGGDRDTDFLDCAYGDARTSTWTAGAADGAPRAVGPCVGG